MTKFESEKRKAKQNKYNILINDIKHIIDKKYREQDKFKDFSDIYLEHYFKEFDDKDRLRIYKDFKHYYYQKILETKKGIDL
jgi:hypothetical protein